MLMCIIIQIRSPILLTLFFRSGCSPVAAWKIWFLYGFAPCDETAIMLALHNHCTSSRSSGPPRQPPLPSNHYMILTLHCGFIMLILQHSMLDPYIFIKNHVVRLDEFLTLLLGGALLSAMWRTGLYVKLAKPLHQMNTLPQPRQEIQQRDVVTPPYHHKDFRVCLKYATLCPSENTHPNTSTKLLCLRLILRPGTASDSRTD